MKNDTNMKKDYDHATLPRSAAECSMEEAYDLGYLSGPAPQIPATPPKTESIYVSRTDVVCPR